MWRALVLLMLPLVLACHRRVPPVEINLLWQRDYLNITPADVNGDSTDEFVSITDDYVLNRISSDMRAAGKTIWTDRGTFTPYSVVGESKKTGFWYTHVRHDSLLLFSSLAGRDLLVTCGHDSLPPAGWDGSASGVTLLDIDNDGRLDAIVSFGSGYDARPRGMCAIDYAAGGTIWTYLTGPNIDEPPTFADIDHDGQTEILFGSLAQRNGNVANGTADDSTYVFLLDCRGRLRWARRIGRYSSIAHSAFAPASRGMPGRVVVYETGSEEDGRSGDSAFILDWRTGEVLVRRQYGRYSSCGTTARGADGRTRTVLGGSDDTLRVLDDSLRLTRSAWFRGGIRQVIAGSFSDRGQDELVVLTNDGLMILLDTLLRTRAVKPCPSTAVTTTFRLVRYEGKNRLLGANSNGPGRTWQLYDFRTVPVIQRRVPLTSVLTGLGFLLATFVAVLLLLQSRQTRDIRAVIRGLTGQAGVVELNLRGDVKRTNPKARELLGGETIPYGPLAQAVKAALGGIAGTNPRELPVALDNGKTVLARAARVRTGVMLTLEDISAVEYLQWVKAWAPVAQKLAHGIKNPLGTIMGAVEQIETEVNRRRTKSETRGEKLEARSAEEGSAEEVKSQKPEAKSQDDTEKADERVKKYIGYVKDEVARLKKMTDAFMRFTKLNPPALEPKNVNELVRKVVAKYEGALAKGISLELSLDDRLPLVALDEEGIANVLDIVVENAVEAMTVNPKSTTEIPSHQAPDGTDAETRQHGDAARALRTRTSVGDSESECHSEGVRRVEESRLSDPSTPLGVTKGGGSYVRIEVEDTGMGIPQKYLDKVFEPYFTYGKADGTGLGLALAKKIVEDHKGRMEMQSKEGVGTTVTIVLPAKGNGE